MSVHLDINITWAQIGINQNPPRLALETHIPNLPRQTRPPEVKIKREEPRIEIEMSHVRGELGFRDPLPFFRHCASLGWQEAVAGTKQKAREGDRMARYYTGEKAIAAIARENSVDSAEVNLALWPTRPPVIKVDTGGLKIDVQPGGTGIDYAPARVGEDFTWGKVQVYLRQKPGIEIRAVFDARV
ncbi:MAG: DUF6470 family protein [bacterium]